MKEVLGRPIDTTHFADLHVHTTGSDGKMTPEQAVEFAQSIGLSAIAIADHHTTKPALAAHEHVQREGLEIQVIVGTEVRTKDGHVVGLFLKGPIERNITLEQTLCAIHEQGGLTIAPHPFFRVSSLTDERIIDIMKSRAEGVYFDGFEVCNAGVQYQSLRNDRIQDTNIAAQFFYSHYRQNRSIGAAIASSDGHRYTCGSAITGYNGDLKTAILQQRTLAVQLEPHEQWELLLKAIELFGEQRVIRNLSLAELKEKFFGIR